MQPQTKIKVVWYALLSALGLFHAEVLSWSAPDVLYNPLTFAIVAPVYTVHYVLFGELMGRRQGDLKVLYLFGCLTGMYEFVITKVFWSPPWNPGVVGPLGVAWVETLWIGFTWHAFMTFLIPFFLMRALFTPGGARPSRGLLAILLVAPTMSGVFGLGFGQDLSQMLVSLTLSFAVVAALAMLWLRWAPRWGFQGVEQLQFGRTGRRAAIGAFLAVYAVYGLLLRPEVFPVGLALVPVVLLYAGLVPLTLYYFRRAAPLSQRAGATLDPRPAIRYLVMYFLAFVGIFLGLAGLHVLLPGVLPMVSVGIVLGSVAIPLVLLGSLALGALRERRTRVPLLPEPVD